MKRILIASLLMFLLPQLSYAEYRLSWDIPDDDRIIGIKIYHGISEFDINNAYDAGYTDSLSMMSLNLAAGFYYLNATSYSDDDESNRSETITFINYVHGNEWTRIESRYYLGVDEYSDYNGSGILNIDNPDISGSGYTNQQEMEYFGDQWNEDSNGNGIINIFDPLADRSHFPSNEYEFDPAMGYVDHLYVIEVAALVFVGLRTYQVSKLPVVTCFDRVMGLQRNIIYGDEDYSTVSLESLGNLDGEGGEEVAVTLRHKETEEIVVEIRDIITGKLYVPPSHCEIVVFEHQYFQDSDVQRLAILGFCPSSNRSLVRIIDPGTRQIIQDINFLSQGELPLGMGIYSVDDSTMITVARIPAGSELETINLSITLE